MVNPSRLQREYYNETFKIKIMRKYSIAGKLPSARVCNYRNQFSYSFTGHQIPLVFRILPSLSYLMSYSLPFSLFGINSVLSTL